MWFAIRIEIPLGRTPGGARCGRVAAGQQQRRRQFPILHGWSFSAHRLRFGGESTHWVMARSSVTNYQIQLGGFNARFLLCLNFLSSPIQMVSWSISRPLWVFCILKDVTRFDFDFFQVISVFPNSEMCSTFSYHILRTILSCHHAWNHLYRFDYILRGSFKIYDAWIKLTRICFFFKNWLSCSWFDHVRLSFFRISGSH